MRNIFTLVFAFITFFSATAQTPTVKGRVVDENNQPLAGALIRWTNTDKSTRSNNDGSFTIVAGSSAVLEISAPGYASVLKNAEEATTIQLQRTARQLATVLVSASRREASLFEVPASITALNSEKIEQYRLWNLRDLSAVSPNLYAADPGDNRNVTSVRGIVSTSYDQAVATYVDGVAQFNLDTYIPQLFDVERIEVLRGPQGMLYGRNAMGGVIHVITKRPSDNTQGFAQVNVGNYNQQRYTAGLRLPLIKGKLYAGAAGLYERRNGFYLNEFNGKDYDRQRTAAGNYYLRFTPGEHWLFNLNVKHSHNRNNGPFPLVFGKEEALAKPFVLNQNALTTMVDDALNTSLGINHEGRGFQLSSQTAYQSNYRYYTNPIDADFSPLDAVSLINNYGRQWNRVEVVTQEVNIRSSLKNKPWQWSAGSFLFWQNSPVKQTTRFGSDAALIGAPDQNFSLINTTTSKGNGLAVYGQLGYAISKKWQLAAGLRYDYENRKQQILGEYQKDPATTPQFAYRPDTSGSASFDALSPSLHLSFTPGSNQLYYVSYNKGFRAGGLTPLSSDPSQPALFPFQPEASHSLETGFKHKLPGNRLQYSVALFYSKVNDVQVPTLVLPDAITVTRNTGALTSKGVEVALSFLGWKGLLVDYNFGYTDAQYDNLKIAQGGTEVDIKGKRQVFTPDLTSMLAVQQNIPLSKSGNCQLSLRGEWRYLGNQFFDLSNTIEQGTYNIFNTRVGITAGKYEVMLWGRNLSNTRFISYAYDFGAIHLGEPYTYGVTATARF